MSEYFPYEDIVNLPHPERKTHPRMSMANRAAQFAPFAALTGHDKAIAETARQTSAHAELSADQLQGLSRKLNYAMSFAEHPVLDITYFKPDEHKTGGSYVTIRGSIKNVKEVYNLLTLVDGTTIPLNAISDLQSEIFNNIDL